MRKRGWSFESWMEAFDRVAMSFGIDYRDMPDVSFADWFEHGTTPTAAFKRAFNEWRTA